MRLTDVGLTVRKPSLSIRGGRGALLNLFRTPVVLGALVLCATACGDNATDPITTARLRVINSLYQGADAATAVPVAIDVLLDSASTTPGSIIGLAANSVSTGSPLAGTSAGVQGTTSVAGYTSVPVGVHGFLARVSGASNPTLFLNASGTAFAPEMTLTPFPYTMIVAGIAPVTGPPASFMDLPIVMLGPDDPFSPPADTVYGGLTARLHVINAAPMASATGNGARITATFTGAAGALTAAASYRSASPYINPPARTYTLTITTAAATLYTGQIILAKGEVRTIVVQSTGYSATPGPANTAITNLLDNQY
jgi:hypothetical protein